MFRRLRYAVVTLAAVLALSSCSSRVDDAEIAEASRGSGPVAPAGAALTAPGDPAPSTAGVGVDIAAPAAPAATGVQETTTGTTAAPASAGAGPSKSGGKAVESVGGKTAPVASRAACAKQLAPIVLGQVGAFSGLVGQSTGNIRLGLQLWANHVNALGGVQCHPVQLIQRDDGSDPSKTASIAQEMITQQKVQAFVGTDTPITIAALRSVISKYKIPVVGGELVPEDWNKDPLLFPQGSSPPTQFIGSNKFLQSQTGVKKLAVIHCVEATACVYSGKLMADKANADKAGVEVVSVQGASLTQTDYTAVCQNAKSAGAQATFVTLDASALQRFARSCAAIGFNVPLAATSIQVSPPLLADANLNKIGMYIATPVVPFLVNRTPAQNAFHDAAAKFAPGAKLDGPSMVGWVAGKLFETAIAAVADTARSGDLTTATVFKGLYALKNETLGSLTQPLNYVEGKPAPIIPCFYGFMLKDGKFSAPIGDQKICL